MDSASQTAGPSVADEGLTCPLCEYSLRGLQTPRCPECGYAFDWEELRRQRLEHPYLFEHANRRKVRAFVKTLLWGWRPLRFWRDVRPTHEVRPGRIVRYWAWASVLSLLIAVGGYVHYAILFTRDSLAGREMVAQSLPPPGPGRRLAPNLPQYLDQRFPLPSSWTFHRYAYHEFGRALPFIGAVVLLFLSWPWMTMATLMIFRISMRRARIRPAHVVRCVVYSFDLAAPLAPLVLAAAATHALWVVKPSPWFSLVGEYAFTMDGGAEKRLVLTGMFLLLAAGAVRLAVAYWSYLRFPRPLLVVFASQVIVWLTALLVLVGVDAWMWGR